MNACFSPAVVEVRPGTTVTWNNLDALDHVVVPAGLSWEGHGREPAEPIRAGDTIQQRFYEPGIYPYACYLHPGMVGAVVVTNLGGEQPSAAEMSATGSDGSSPMRVPVVAVVGVAVAVAIGAALLAARRRSRSRPAAA